ncbi:methyltransferase domain-containing protein [Arcobacter sp.]|uniref:class I SAM-dependent methyltransferase n=1 Tax=Arcobacter sp. TaxID=1872629 RepID=UPI003C718FC2
MNKDWIYQQTLHNVSQWDKIMEHKYPEVKEWNNDGNKYFIQVCEKCNFLDATKVIDFDKFLNDNSTVIDLGCGGGWLSAYLSRFEKVKIILAIDTSKNYLYNILPTVIKILKGKSEKIVPVEGLFSPLMLEDNSVDLIVASAAFHHAFNLEELFKETYSKLKKGGYLIVLNETPISGYLYIKRIIKAFIKILYKVLKRQYESPSPKISVNGFEYDPYLGDKNYPFWYWERAIKEADFELVEIIDTNLTTVKNVKSDKLIHFVCKK